MHDPGHNAPDPPPAPTPPPTPVRPPSAPTHPPTAPGERRAPRKPSIGDDAGVRLLLPVGRSGWAIAAGYMGLFSILLAPAPFAIILGFIAIHDIRRHPGRHGMGRAIFGIVAGTLVILAVVAAFVMSRM